MLAPPPQLGADVQPFVHVPAGQIAITHLRIIDGTGAAPIEDATLLIDGAKIGAVQPAGRRVPAGYRMIDGTGETALPGLVGMHNHMFYIARPNIDASGHSEDPLVVPQMTFSAPRLYLANGVTTMRTTGSVEPYTDLNLKREIDAGRMIGPHMDVTGPYLEGAGSLFIQMHQLHDRRGRAADGRLLGRPGRDLVQGVHEHHARRAQSRDRRGAQARTSRSPAICAR